MLLSLAGKWRRWRSESIGRRIFAALVAVGGATALVKLAGAVKLILIARHFGAGDELDAYFVAFLIPSFLSDVAAEAAGAALIPTFVDVREKQGPQAAQRLLRSVLFLSACASLSLLAAVLVFSDPLLRVIASGFSAAKLELTRKLLWWMAPILCLGGLASIWRSVLTTAGQFGLPAASLGLTPVTIIAMLLLAGGRRNAEMLAAGTLIGSLLEASVIAWQLHRSRISPFPTWAGLDPEAKTVIAQYWPLAASTLLFGASAYVNQAFSAMLPPGSVSALNYGNRVLNVLLAVGPTALGVALLPHFSESAARGDWHTVRTVLKRYRRIIWLGALPLTLVLAVLSEPMVRLIFERGRFVADDTAVVARVQQLFLLQIPAMIQAVMVCRLISSIRANHLLIAGAAISLTANLAANVVLMPKMGVAGIALASTIAAYCYCGYMSWALNRLEPAASRSIIPVTWAR